MTTRVQEVTLAILHASAYAILLDVNRQNYGARPKRTPRVTSRTKPPLGSLISTIACEKQTLPILDAVPRWCIHRHQRWPINACASWCEGWRVPSADRLCQHTKRSPGGYTYSAHYNSIIANLPLPMSADAGLPAYACGWHLPARKGERGGGLKWHRCDIKTNRVYFKPTSDTWRSRRQDGAQMSREHALRRVQQQEKS